MSGAKVAWWWSASLSNAVTRARGMDPAPSPFLKYEWSLLFVSVGMLLMCVCVCFQIVSGLVVGCGGIPPLVVLFVFVLCIEVVCCSLCVS